MDLSKLAGNERIIAEHAVLAYQAVRQAAQDAPQGQGMDRIEQAVLKKGFETLRRMIELGASEHPEAQKGVGSKACPCGQTMNYRGLIAKTFVSAVGLVRVSRRYYASRECPCKLVAWDDWAGIPAGHKLTVQARRMVTLVGSCWSFDEASDKLAELCHLQVSNDVIRRVCNTEGEQAKQWLAEASESAEPMMRAAGEVEFYADGVQVNTTGGWREMRLSVFAKRPAASPAEPGQWQERVLEEPACRVAWAAIAASNVIGSSWRRMLRHLGLEDTPRLSVLGDGARWIWDEAAKRFKLIVNVEWVVDVYHVGEHVHGCAQALFGVHSPQARHWGTARVEELIEMEGPRFIESLRQQQAAATDPASREALGALIRYLSENRDSLWYRTRLAEGLPIGSGLVEGTCKNVIGKRLKLNNPRWRVRRAENMAALRCLHYSQLWEAYWEAYWESRVWEPQARRKAA